MRIGMMADAYKPHVSGITHHIRLTKRALEAAGHKVFVFTFGGLEYEDDELNIVRCPGIPLSDTGYYFSLRYTRHARRKLQTMDVIHVHHPFLSGRLAVRYARPFGIPVVFTNHTRYDLYAHTYLPLVPEEISTTFIEAYLTSLCREVDLVIAPSAGLRDVLRDVLKIDARIEVVPNGVDLAPFLALQGRGARGALGFEEADVVLVYVGRLGPEKNLTFLVRAFGGIHAAYPQARLLLVGDGPERENLEDQVKRSALEGKVVFAGMVEYSDLASYLAAGDVFVTASVTEVHPLTVIEALASGLPVMGIRSPGVEDTVEEGVNGFLSPEDLAGFTAKLARLLAEPETRRRMAGQARRSAELYAVDRTSAVLSDHYERLVAARPTRRENRWRMAWERLVDRVT
jgi:glycosyltransferase involved in cell wall biosynthesis